MKDKKLIFIGGLHKSGTSLLHEILRSHPSVSGFKNTGVPEDEGQHLQTVYPPGKAFGLPGEFGFNKLSHMDENHPLAKPENAAKLFREWSHFWDLEKYYLLEKSPPNIVRTRFLQYIFPESIFIIIFRHPIALAYATKKWSKTSIPSLLEHSLCCYERFWKDRPFLNKVYLIHYEEFVLEPSKHIHELLDWIGIESEEFQIENKVLANINDQYFALWEADRNNLFKRLLGEFKGLSGGKLREFEKRANVFGYSINNPSRLLPIS